MTTGVRVMGLSLALLVAPAWADITLTGFQHVGDGENASFRPRDPVTRVQMQANPTNFFLSQVATVTAVRLENANDLDAKLRIFIDDMTTPLAGTLSGATYTLTTPLTLPAGAHTIWPDGGCSLGGFAMPCVGGENDFGFSAITLVSAQTSTSRNFSQRRHIGDSNDSDDDYGARWYPDRAEATALSLSFTLETPRVLTQARFHRLREVASAPLTFAKVVLDAGTPDTVQIGELTANGALFTIDSSLALAAGAHTLTVTAGVALLLDEDDLSWDDLILLFTPVAASVPGVFNAVDPGITDVATGPLTTKTAGTTFTVDIAALLDGALFAGYTGTVTVELVDASDPTGSCTRWPLAASLGSVTFSAANAGRKSLTATYPEALADARLRINDASIAVTSCSTDNFAIKPAGFGGITVSHLNASTAGDTEALVTAGFTAASLPMHRAGRPFTIQASARNSAGAVTTRYAGSPSVNAAATIAGMGTVLGNAAASGWTSAGGYVRSDTAHYDEVGAVTLELVDTTFADVDADDTPLKGGPPNRQVGPTPFSVGRFIPDRFTFAQLTAATFVPGCSGAGGGFTYVGQPFVFAATPTARVTAVAMGGTPTRNYSDAGLYKITLDAGGGALPQSAHSVVTGAFDFSNIPSPDNTFANEGNGASLFTLLPRPGGYVFTRGAPSAPFTAEVRIALTFAETDGVTFDPATPALLGDSATGFIPFASGYDQFRFGRLTVANAHGSERLPLDVPLQAEYVGSSGSGFVLNGADNCSPLLLTDLVLTGDLVGLPDPPANTTPSLSAILNGKWALHLTAPQDPGQVAIRAAIGASLPWLQTDDTDVDLIYDDDPMGLATFGIYHDNDRRIYLREVIGF